MVKQFLSIFLFLSLVAPFAISYVGLKTEKTANRREIKHRMMEALSRDQLVFLKIAKTDAGEKLLWKHASEFKYGNYYYDVVEKNETKDSLLFWLWKDHKETDLNKKLAALAGQMWNTNPNREEQAAFFDLLSKSVFLEKKPSNSMDDWLGFSFLYGTFLPGPSLAGNLKINLPPPQLQVFFS